HFEQGEGVGGGTGETGNDLAVAAEAADLAGVGLHHRVAEGDLAVAGDGDAAVAAHRDDGGGVEGGGVLAGVHNGLRGRTPWMGVGRAAFKPRTGRSVARALNPHPSPTTCVWRAGGRRRKRWPGAGNRGGYRS